MGEEVSKLDDSAEHLAYFQDKLREETRFLNNRLKEGDWNQNYGLGWELEFCITDGQGQPLAKSQQLMTHLNQWPVTYELAAFNVELNGRPHQLSPDLAGQLEEDFKDYWHQLHKAALAEGVHLGLYGILPSLAPQHFEPQTYMAPLKRYAEISERIIKMRGRAVHLHLDFEGAHLTLRRDDVMLEALSTSLQVHVQIPANKAANAYNYGLWVCGWVMGVAANSSLVMGQAFWDESRIPVFEQTVDTRTHQEIVQGVPSRIHLAQGYIHSWDALFEQNLAFPIIMPQVFGDTPVEALKYFALHNGTLWRWLRPIVALDGLQPHLRLEFRTLPAGPTQLDTLANIWFLFGLMLAQDQLAEVWSALPFRVCQHDFYEIARFGLKAQVHHPSGRRLSLGQLVHQELLPAATEALRDHGLATDWLEVIQQRVAEEQTGAQWLRKARENHNIDQLMSIYMENAAANRPVGDWKPL